MTANNLSPVWCKWAKMKNSKDLGVAWQEQRRCQVSEQEHVISVGDKVHIITRRLFEGEVLRHFVGEVTRISGTLQEVQGFAFVHNRGTNEYKKRPELRTRIFSLGQADFIVNKIPPGTAVESLEYRYIENRLVITDRKGFSLDINEFGHMA